MEMMKRKKGEGMIREYEPGKWVARITLNGKQKAFYGVSEKEVAKKLKDFKKNIERGQTDIKRMSYSDFLDEWLAMKKDQLKPQSYDRLESTVEIHIKPLIGFYDLDKLDDTIIREDVIGVKVKTLSHSSVKKIYDALNSSFKYAQKKGKVIHNPVSLVVLPSPASRKYAKKDNAASLEIFNDDEIKRFIDAVHHKFGNNEPVYKNAGMFVLMLNTGLRLGEATSLKWSDYNEDTQTIRVYSSMVYAKDEDGKKIYMEQDSVKTRNSERVLKLNAKAVAALPAYRKGKYIYCTTEGNPLRPRTVQNTLDSVLERAGIPHKSTHIFRHTFASKLFAKGIDVKIVSELLGHSDVRVTYNTYISLIKQQKALAMEAIDVMY
jgi:integrase